MIPISLLDFHIETKFPLDFGANPGSSLRGALYEALQVMYDHDYPVQSRHEAEANPVAWLLRLEDYETTGGKDVPRPFAIRPPRMNHQTQSQFGMAFYGQGQNYIPLALSAWDAIQQIGLGRGRQKFHLAGVFARDVLSGHSRLLVKAGGEVVGEIPPPPSAQAYQGLAKLLKSKELSLRFLTPTRIVDQKVLQHQAQFLPWFKRLLERTRTISELYLPEPLWIPFADLLGQARQVKILKDQSQWQEMWSGSRRDGEMKPASGFVGQVSYQGDFEELLPWILLGQNLQVGKNTVHGGGWYEVLYDWS
jgi:hypothetical protein